MELQPSIPGIGEGGVERALAVRYPRPAPVEPYPAVPRGGTVTSPAPLALGAGLGLVRLPGVVVVLQ
jgi:hypothetical protein